MNEDKKIDVYANLLRAWKDGKLTKDIFWRLSFILPNIYYDDLIYLKDYKSGGENKVPAESFSQPIEVNNLANHNLLRCTNEGNGGAFDGYRTYAVSKLSLQMIEFGFDDEI